MVTRLVTMVTRCVTMVTRCATSNHVTLRVVLYLTYLFLIYNTNNDVLNKFLTNSPQKQSLWLRSKKRTGSVPVPSFKNVRATVTIFWIMVSYLTLFWIMVLMVSYVVTVQI